jgi:hypothetical protein
VSGVGPVQMVVVGFPTTDRFRGHIARELLELRGRGMIRVLDARLLHRSADGELTEIDLGPLLGEPPPEGSNPVARLLGVNGAGGNGAVGAPDGHTVGFALEDLRRLTDEIGPGDYAAAVLVEHLWAARLRDAVRDAGGSLLGQGFLTPEVVMIVGAEIQALADARQALEMAESLRGSALLEALAILESRPGEPAEERARAAAAVVRVLTAEGFVHEADAHGAIEALVDAGLVEEAMFRAAAPETDSILRRLRDEPPADGA